MKIYTKEELNNYSQSLTYDDISLVPTEISRIKSRSEAVTSTEFLGAQLAVPVISSPMDSVTGIEMAQELNNLGCLGILNRFDSSLDEILSGNVTNGIRAVSIGLTTEDELIEKLVEKGFIICIDTANANNHEVLKKTEDVKKK